MALHRAVVLDQLRMRLQGVSPALRQVGAAPTGLPCLDAWLGGWPRPGIVEVVGPPGSGRLEVVLPALIGVGQGRAVLVVDPEHQAHPPGWPGWPSFGPVSPGVRWAPSRSERVVLVRPPRERAGWVAEQAARSGALEAVLVLDAPPLGRAGLRLSRAAEAGECTLFVVAGAPDADLPAALRLRAEGWTDGMDLRLSCSRGRGGRAQGTRIVRRSVACAA